MFSIRGGIKERIKQYIQNELGRQLMRKDMDEKGLSEIPIDTSVAITNLSTYKEAGRIKFSGRFSPVLGKEIDGISVYSNGVLRGSCKPHDPPSEGKHKIFEIETDWCKHFRKYEFCAEYAGRGSALTDCSLITVIPEDYEGLEEYKRASSFQFEALPRPTGEIVFRTQGNRNVDAYMGSIIPGMYRLRMIFDELNLDHSRFDRVLDFGCGSGRILGGWHLDNPDRQLYGVDNNEQLIEWARSNFPANMSFSKNELSPPLDFEDRFFDCIYLFSVFTHLTLRNQFLWLEEFRRILKKGSPLLISLHGPYFLDAYRERRSPVYNEIINKRYWDNSLEYDGEGKNRFIAFHMPDYAVDVLFNGWKILGYFPGGRVKNQYLATGKQDIYVLQS